MKNNRGKNIIFFSVDIAGSSTFKQQTGYDEEGRSKWLPLFVKFFKEVPLVFIGQIAFAFMEEPHIPNVRVWRVIGDEIVFFVELNTVLDGLLLVEAFCNTITLYDRQMAKEGMGIRGCVWGAQFPIPNMVVEVPEMGQDVNQPESIYQEFLGPDIDTGFLLEKGADPGQTIVSLNVATSLAATPRETNLIWGLKGYEPLKRLFSKAPYPLLLVSTRDDTTPLRDTERLSHYDILRISEEFSAGSQHLPLIDPHIRLVLDDQ